MALEVDIRCKEEQDIEVKQPNRPVVELYALHFGKRINFEAQVNQTEKGLQLDIHEGMSFKILAPSDRHPDHNYQRKGTLETRGLGAIHVDCDHSGSWARFPCHYFCADQARFRRRSTVQEDEGTPTRDFKLCLCLVYRRSLQEQSLPLVSFPQLRPAHDDIVLLRQLFR